MTSYRAASTRVVGLPEKKVLFVLEYRENLEYELKELFKKIAPVVLRKFT